MFLSLGECQTGTPRALVVTGQGRLPSCSFRSPGAFSGVEVGEGGAQAGVFQNPGPRVLVRNVLRKELRGVFRYSGCNTTNTVTVKNGSVCVCVCVCVCVEGHIGQTGGEIRFGDRKHNCLWRSQSE